MKKFFTLLISFSLLALTTVPTFASTNVLFTNIPDPVPGNVPSMGVEAYSMSEIGSQIQLVGKFLIIRPSKTRATVLAGFKVAQKQKVTKNS